VPVGEQTIDQCDLAGRLFCALRGTGAEARDVFVAQPLPGKIAALLLGRTWVPKVPGVGLRSERQC
jgi:hypothetical protein